MFIKCHQCKKHNKEDQYRSCSTAFGTCFSGDFLFSFFFSYAVKVSPFFRGGTARKLYLPRMFFEGLNHLYGLFIYHIYVVNLNFAQHLWEAQILYLAVWSHYFIVLAKAFLTTSDNYSCFKIESFSSLCLNRFTDSSSWCYFVWIAIKLVIVVFNCKEERFWIFSKTNFKNKMNAKK